MNLYDVFSEIHNSISSLASDSFITVAKYLELGTRFLYSSSISYNRTSKGQNKIIELGKVLNANTYINPINGIKLYDKKEFKKNGIELFFLKMKEVHYSQFDKENFIPNLSIIDVLMFNPKEKIRQLINKYQLV